MSCWFSLVVDLPRWLPCDALVCGLLPTPIQAGMQHNGFFPGYGRSFKDHLAIAVRSDEIQVHAPVIHPGLLPVLAGRVVDGEAQSFERIGGAGVEGL